ncbi:MAG: N-glycosylase/DNA lyase [Elusimicrobia bacterium]|nr:N-glycosylase/DNA lyase [Elusimicrobiota bacterium]
MIERLKKLYREKKKEIDCRLEMFRKTGDSGDRKIFAELCFCLLTPQSKAVVCDSAIRELVDNSLLYSGSGENIKKHLRKVRFYNNKARYIMNARRRFTAGGRLRVSEFVNSEVDLFLLRDKLVREVKGYGLKEAAHFLRNIGRGSGLAILDRHIIKELKKYGVIRDIPKTLTRKRYLEIEKKMKRFSKDTGIPMDALDLLFWYGETGYFFK